MSAPPRRSEHSPASLCLSFTPCYAVGGPHKTTTQITILLAACAATAGEGG